jgi:hypothetical protein
MFKNEILIAQKTKHCVAIIHISLLMFIREITSVYFDNHMKPISTLCGQKCNVLMVKQVIHTM